MANFKINVDVNNKSVNQLEEDLQSLEAQFKQLKIGDPGFVELGNQIKGIRSQLKDVELQFEGLDKEQRATALVDTFTGLTGAVGAVSSAFLAFGASSEAIEDVEKKLLGIIGVVSGLRDVSNGLVAFQKLGPEISKSFEGVGASIKGAFTTAEGAINGTKVALAGLGIAAAIMVITQLVEASNKLSIEQKALAAAAEEEAKKRDELNKSIEDEYKKVGALLAVAEDENTSKENRRKAIEKIQEQYPDYLANQNLDKVSTEDIAQANRDLQTELVKRARAQAVANEVAAIGAKILQQDLNLLKLNNDEQKIRNDLTLSPAQQELAIKQAGIELGKQIANQQLEELKNQQQVLLNLAQQEKLTDNIVETQPKVVKGLSDEEKELEAIKLRLEEIEKLSNKFGKDFEKSFELVSKGIETKVKPALDEYGNVIKGLPNPFEGVTVQYDQSAKIFKNGFDKFVTGLKASAEELANSTSQALGDFATLQETIAKQGLESGKLTEAEAEKAFERSKKLRKANVLIDSSQAAIGIFTSSTSLPEPFATANRIIQLAALSAATAASIKQIDSATLGGGGGGATPITPSYRFGSTTSLAGGTPMTGAPAGSALPTSQQGNAQTPGQIVPIKTYVLSGDVTTAQSADAKLRNQRKL